MCVKQMPKLEKVKPQIDPKLEAAIVSAVQGDYRPFQEGYLIIRDEHESFVPLTYNHIQEHYEAHETLRDIVVKARKIGFTTRWMGKHFPRAIMTEGYQALAFTYDEDEAEYMFGIANRFYEMLPKGTPPRKGKDTGTAMGFPKIDSGIDVQSSGGRRKGRGRTPSAILLDEFAQYDENVAVDIFSSVVNSAPLWVPITIQSTPRGIGNEFHRQFVRAENGESTFKAHFYPWMWLPEKHRITEESATLAAHEWLKGTLEYTDEERLLLETWNAAHPDLLLDQDNIRWRRYKAAEDPDTFKQEYPENSVDCFLATTDSVFDTKLLTPWVQRAHPPLFTDRNNTLKVWKRPQPGQAYCIGVDCGEGIVGRDNSAAEIGTVRGEVVAVLAGIYDQVEFAQMVYEIGMQYNEAFVLNERQGGFTFQLTLHNMGYKNLYRHVDQTAAIRSKAEPALGFPTSTASKGLLINTMRAALKSDGFQCPDIQTLREMVEYKRHKDGTYGAPVGVDSHDDRAMASMMYLQAIAVCERTPARVKRGMGAGRTILSYPTGALA